MFLERCEFDAAGEIERRRLEAVVGRSRGDGAFVVRQILPGRARAVHHEDGAVGKSGKRERADRMRLVVGKPFDPGPGLAGPQYSVAAQVVGRILASPLDGDDDHVQVVGVDPGVVQAIGDGERGGHAIDALALDAGETLLLDRHHQSITVEQAHGPVMGRIDAHHPRFAGGKPTHAL